MDRMCHRGAALAWILAGFAASLSACHACAEGASGMALGDATSDADEDADRPDATPGDASDAGDDAAEPDSGLLRATGPLTFRLASGNDVPDRRPNAWAYVPTRFRPSAPLHVVVLFHGFRNCIFSYTALGGRPCVPMGPKRTGYDLVHQMERSESGAVLVVPEIAFNADTSDPLKLGYKGALRAFLEELLDGPLAPYIGEHRSQDIERLALGASSGGYQALLPALEVGGEPVTDLYFFDALYIQPVRGSALGNFLWSGLDAFDPGKPARKRFGVVYTDNGGATAQSEATAAEVRAWLVDGGRETWGSFERRDAEPTVDDLQPPISIVFSGSEHDKIMHRDFWTVMKASGL